MSTIYSLYAKLGEKADQNREKLISLKWHGFFPYMQNRGKFGTQIAQNGHTFFPYMQNGGKFVTKIA